ncbi:MAG: DNA-protecting protein DprA [Fimbriimonadaceae bacterium]|nr:DNA-protecting protein DprA [Fimbriimonadaceae bacterium]
MERGEWSARAVLAGLYARGAFAQGAAPPIGLSSLQSLEKLPRRKWPQVRDLLLQSDVPLSDVPGLLRRNGLWEEASLCSTGFLAYGLSLVETGQVVTAACVSYPAAWLTRLGSGSPPAFWASGPLPPGLGSLRLSSAGAALSEPVAGPGSALSGSALSGSALSGSAGRDPGGRSSSQGGSAGSVIGVVGSRQLSQMGERVAWTLGGAIAKAGCILVSGGAVGADRWSALGARGN